MIERITRLPGERVQYFLQLDLPEIDGNLLRRNLDGYAQQENQRQ